MSVEDHPNFHAVNFATKVTLYSLGKAQLEGASEEVEYIERAYLESITKRGIDSCTAPNIRPLIKSFRKECNLPLGRDPLLEQSYVDVCNFVLAVESVVDWWRESQNHYETI